MGTCFVWCAAGHCARSTAVFLVYKWHYDWNRIWDSFIRWWLCLQSSVDSTGDTSKLQKDIDELGKLARKWGMRFQPVKCNIMQLTRKRIKKINAVNTFEGTVLENVDSIKYVGVTVSKDLKWNTHVSNVCTKANRTLGFLRRNLLTCPQDVKETAHKGLVRPVLEYARPVWDPHGIVVRKN